MWCSPYSDKPSPFPAPHAKRGLLSFSLSSFSLFPFLPSSSHHYIELHSLSLYLCFSLSLSLSLIPLCHSVSLSSSFLLRHCKRFVVFEFWFYFRTRVRSRRCHTQTARAPLSTYVHNGMAFIRDRRPTTDFVFRVKLRWVIPRRVTSRIINAWHYTRKVYTVTLLKRSFPLNETIFKTDSEKTVVSYNFDSSYFDGRNYKTRVVERPNSIWGTPMHYLGVRRTIRLHFGENNSNTRYKFPTYNKIYKVS